MTISNIIKEYYKKLLDVSPNARHTAAHPPKDFFEDWYFKHQNERQVVCFIVGRSRHQGRGQAFIQVLVNQQAYFIPFDYSQCHIRRHPLRVQIGENGFSESGIRVQLCSDGLCLFGEIAYGALCRMRGSMMGPFRFVPHMECSHEITSMKHAISGKLTVNGQGIWFLPKNSCGYMEGDAGTSFPREYLWIHCNAFDQTDCSVTACVAKVPFLRWEFTGYLCQVQLPGASVRFASYNPSRLVYYSKRGLALQKGEWSLCIRMLDSPPPTPALKAPQMGDMARTVSEHVDRTARFTLQKGKQMLLNRVSGQVCYEWVR